MTREETVERIKVMQAFVDGKQIQYKESGGKWKDVKDPMWSSINEYRIKPKPKYRPFANIDECWQEMQKHQPFGWVKASHGYFNIIGIINDKINFGTNNNWLDYEYIFKMYKFIDGTTFGIKEE